MTLPPAVVNLLDVRGRASRLLYALLLLAVAFWLVSRTGGEKRRIEKRLERLEELVEKNGDESQLVSANKARNVGLLFAREFAVDLKGRARGVVTERPRIAQVTMQYRSAPSRIRVEFSGVEISLGAAERSAEMTAVATATATTGGDLSRRRFRLAFRWIQEDGEWVIERAELVEEVEPGLF